MVLPVRADLDLEALGARFRAETLPAIALEGALDAHECANARAHFELHAWRECPRADLGRYLRAALAPGEPWLGPWIALASSIVRTTLVASAADVTRLARGGYVLTRDELAKRTGDFELIVDLSPAASGAGEACYRHRGELFFVAPQTTGSVALVGRGPTITRYDRYLPHTVGDAEVWRVRVALESG